MHKKTIGTTIDLNLANFETTGSMGGSDKLFLGLVIYRHIK
jgi:hypothetical protein